MGRNFGTTHNGLYYTLKNGLVRFEELPDWYGIEGIKFQFINTQTDPRIWYKGRDCSCYDVEDTVWEWFREDHGRAYFGPIEETEVSDVGKQFSEYMLENADEVRSLCEEVLFPELSIL